MKKVLQKYEKTNHSQVKCFLYIKKQKSMQFPKLKTCELWIYLVRETYGRTPKVPKVLVSYIFCTTLISREIETHTILKTREITEFWENTNIQK